MSSWTVSVIWRTDETGTFTNWQLFDWIQMKMAFRMMHVNNVISILNNKWDEHVPGQHLRPILWSPHRGRWQIWMVYRGCVKNRIRCHHPRCQCNGQQQFGRFLGIGLLINNNKYKHNTININIYENYMKKLHTCEREKKGHNHRENGNLISIDWLMIRKTSSNQRLSLALH